MPEPLIDRTVVALRELLLAGERYRTVAAKTLDLTTSESQAAAYLLARGTLGQHELASAVGLTPGSTTALVDRLEARGIVRREPHDTDRRRIMVHLADPLPLVVAEQRSWLVDVCAGLSAGQRTVAQQLLTQLAAALRERTDEGATGS